MKVTQMPSANPVANSGNTAYGVGVIVDLYNLELWELWIRGST